MNRMNELIAMLIAIQSFAKDIHYNCQGDAFYSKHLLCDRIAENINDYIDSIKETVFMARIEDMLSSKQYLEKAVQRIPDIGNDDKESFRRLNFLITNTLSLIEELDDLSVGEENLIGNIAENLQNSLALLNRQVL